MVLQEIFGITGHIRQVADQYAAAGYLAIAPALFDRIAPAIELAYSDMKTAIAHKQAMNNDTVMLDVAAATERVRSAGKVAVVGYCWGGTVAYLAAARLPIDAAIAYYGGDIGRYLGETPRVPIEFHFGERDTHIPASTVDQIKAAHPRGIYHLYPADHGFNCTDRASFEPGSARLAFERSVEFLHNHVG